jgi:hypothetical protein
MTSRFLKRAIIPVATSAIGLAGRLAHASSTSNPDVLGKGVYGTVILPGPLNKNKSGRNINYKNRPVKIMTSKNSFNKSVRNAEKIKRFSNLKYNFVPYEREFTIKNLPPEVQAKVGIESYGPEKPVYLAHMPYLGESINKISETPLLKEKYSAIPVYVYMNEILKLFKTIKELNNAGYMHYDLHPGNILINPDTGEINIIDFDLFTEIENSERRRKAIESYSINLMEYFKRLQSTPVPEFVPSEMNIQSGFYIGTDYVDNLNDYNKVLKSKYDQIIKIQREIQTNGLEQTHKKYLEQMYNNYDFDIKLKYTLQVLFEKILDKPQYEEFRKFMLEEIIPKLGIDTIGGFSSTPSEWNKRFPIREYSSQDIINLLENYINIYMDKKMKSLIPLMRYSHISPRKGGRRTYNKTHKRRRHT